MPTALKVPAQPYEFIFEPAATALLVIDMQRDFILPGGFGELLGNKVALLKPAIEPTRRVLDAFRGKHLHVLHTREGHRPDMSDCPPAKRARGKLKVGIGDQGPMGRVLIRGELGHGIIDELKPLPSEPVIDKPGKGAFFCDRPGSHLEEPGGPQPRGHRGHHRSLRADERPRGE